MGPGHRAVPDVLPAGRHRQLPGHAPGNLAGWADVVETATAQRDSRDAGCLARRRPHRVRDPTARPGRAADVRLSPARRRQPPALRYVGQRGSRGDLADRSATAHVRHGPAGTGHSRMPDRVELRSPGRRRRGPLVGGTRFELRVRWRRGAEVSDRGAAVRRRATAARYTGKALPTDAVSNLRALFVLGGRWLYYQVSNTIYLAEAVQ